MAAHNEVNGMPCHANKELNRALRETFGFGKGAHGVDFFGERRFVVFDQAGAAEKLIYGEAVEVVSGSARR